MKINAINASCQFTGKKEAEAFRQKANSVLKRTQLMRHPSEYTESEEYLGQKRPSIQQNFKDVFEIVPKVGAENANKEDEKLLQKVKTEYVFLETYNRYYETGEYNPNQKTDVAEEVKEIDFKA